MLNNKIITKNKYTQISIPINIESNNNLSGFQQEINKIIINESEKSINYSNDYEVKRYKLKHYYFKLHLMFYDNINNLYSESYNNIGFTNNDINNNSDSFINSYLLISLYDNYDSNNQNLIINNFVSKKPNGNSILPMFIGDPGYRINIPNYYLESTTGDTLTGYTKFMFYNAKNGKYILFYNQNNSSLSTEERFYFKTIINKTNKTWDFPDDIISHFFSSELNIYQEIEAVDYIDKINTMNDNFINKKQQYPNGYIFNIDDGKYTNIIE